MKSLLLVLLAYGQIIHVGGLQCRVGQTEVIPHGSSQPVCCMDITCSQGTQAEPCNAGDPLSSSCIPCPEGQYQTRQTTLSDRLTCSVNLNCTSNHKEYVIRGSSTTKSVCGTCLEGFKETGFHTCIENICPVGQEPEGNSCRWCSVGYFSDKEDNKPCKKRTICECMLIEGNETMDNKCSQDVSLCSTSDGAVTIDAPTQSFPDEGNWEVELTDAVTVDASTLSSPVEWDKGLAVGLGVGIPLGLSIIVGFLYVTIQQCVPMRRNPDATSTVGSNLTDIEIGGQSDDVDTSGRPAPSEDVGPTSGQPAPSGKQHVSSSESLHSSSNGVSYHRPIQESNPSPSRTRESDTSSPGDQYKQVGYKSQTFFVNNEDLDAQTPRKGPVSINSASVSNARTEDVRPNESKPDNEDTIVDENRQNSHNRFRNTFEAENPSSTSEGLQPVYAYTDERLESNKVNSGDNYDI